MTPILFYFSINKDSLLADKICVVLYNKGVQKIVEILKKIPRFGFERLEINNLGKKHILNEAYFNSFFNNSLEAIAIVDINFKVININNSFEDIFQYSLNEIENKDITDILVQEIFYATSYRFRESINNGKFIKEQVKRKKKDGTLLDLLLMGFPLFVEAEVIGAYFIYSDISESIEKDKHINRLKRMDILTGLLNRDSFMQILDGEISKNLGEEVKDKFAILIVKINELNEINDALGILTVDEVLKEFAERLKENIYPQDIIARYSGAGFAILAKNIENLDNLKKMSQRILKCVSEGFKIENSELHITSSMGMSIYPNDGSESTTLVRSADIAMNKSKGLQMEEPIRFNIAQDQEFQRYFWMKNDLARAISNKELFLNYQPIYDTNLNKLVGTEALVRWNYKDGRIIPPLTFIPIAEETGLIHPIGEWVLFNACKQNKEWMDLRYKPIYISVNVSVIQLEDPRFGEMVKRVLRELQLDPRYLQLEITETFFTQSYKLIENTIKDLNSLGIRFAIDDFGTGYSSLGQLAGLNINNLKIDRIFIDGVDRNINKGKIVKTVISLAESLDILLTAEGVETQGELDFLTENRCTVAQGYLFSKPVEANKIENLLERV